MVALACPEPQEPQEWRPLQKYEGPQSSWRRARPLGNDEQTHRIIWARLFLAFCVEYIMMYNLPLTCSRAPREHNTVYCACSLWVLGTSWITKVHLRQEAAST